MSYAISHITFVKHMFRIDCLCIYWHIVTATHMLPSIRSYAVNVQKFTKHKVTWTLAKRLKTDIPTSENPAAF